MLDDARPYPAYKDSGHPWLGDVPEHWEVRRLKHLVRNVSDQTNHPPDDATYIGLEHIKGWTGQTTPAKASAVTGQVKRYQAGDVLFGKLRPYLAKVTKPDAGGVCTGELLVLRAGDDADADYACVTLRSVPFIAWVNSTTFGAKMPRAEWDVIGTARFPIPPPEEQAGIVKVLGAVDRRVNRLVRAKRRLLGLLAEQKQAVITHAITRGLDPHAPTKPSGIPWLGDVPEHWEVRRIKTFARIGNGSTPSRSEPRYWSGGEVPWLNSGTVHLGVVDEAKQFVTNDAVRECHLPRVKEGHLIIAITGQGKTRGTVAMMAMESTISQHVAYISPRSGVAQPNYEYLQLALHAAYAELRQISDGAGGTKGALTCSDIACFYVPLPPSDEQQKIVQQLRDETRAADAAADLARREIDLIREYRTRLVADVVSGKLDVRGVDLDQPQVIENKPKANVHFRRSVFAAEIVHRLHAEPTFGHVKFEKLVFLCERRCGVDTGSTYRRQAAGPYDNRALRSIDSQIRKQKWYEAKKGEKGYRYFPLEKAGGHEEYFGRYFSTVSEEFDRIINRFRTAKTLQCEIVATLYSAWEDLLRGGSATDDAIVEQVLEHWHPNKKAIEEWRWRKALAWMKDEDIVPEGD